MAKKTKTRRAAGWPSDFLARVQQLRARMADSGCDGMLLTNPSDIRYLSGFSGEDSWALVTPTRFVILSDRRFEEELAEGVPFAPAVMRKKSLPEELGKLTRRSRTRKLAVQSEYLTLVQRQAVAKQVGGAGGAKLAPVQGWLLEQRSVKDAGEVALIEQAIAIQQEAFGRTLKKIREGMTERAIAAVLEFEVRKLGADGPAFRTIIGAGPSSSKPHYLPGDVKVKRGEPVLIDFGAVVRGYHSDMTRVVFLGKPTRKMAEVYNVVREAHEAGIAAIAPGKPLKEVDAAARQIIKKAGYGKEFGHGLGHGIGLQIHEEPRLGAAAVGELKAGQVVTVEPGVYLPGVGGVRIEDDVLVTEGGYRRLCSLPTDLESAII